MVRIFDTGTDQVGSKSRYRVTMMYNFHLCTHGIPATHHFIGSISGATFTEYTASKAVLFEPSLRMVSELLKAKTSKF